MLFAPFLGKLYPHSLMPPSHLPIALASSDCAHLGCQNRSAPPDELLAHHWDEALWCFCGVPFPVLDRNLFQPAVAGFVLSSESRYQGLWQYLCPTDLHPDGLHLLLIKCVHVVACMRQPCLFLPIGWVRYVRLHLNGQSIFLRALISLRSKIKLKPYLTHFSVYIHPPK